MRSNVPVSQTTPFLVRLDTKQKALLKKIAHKEETDMIHIIRPIIYREIKRLAKKHGIVE